MTTQSDFDKTFDKAYEEQKPNFDQTINIAIVGKVSAGKSSLLNAILERDRANPIAPVAAFSGVTTKVTPYRLDKQVLIIDCPGLDDVRAENSEETKRFLESIDLGIFVVTGSADASQRSNYQDLKKTAKKTLVVLNKVDEWDDLDESALQEVVAQWKKSLGATQVLETCAKGYDPKMRKDAPMDLRGIDELKGEIFGFLEEEGKEILLAKHLQNKAPYATKIIVAALAAVAGEAFIPGSAAYITGTQIVAITSLYYLYKGEVLTKSSALTLLPVFAGQSIGTNVFLWAKSFLPPTLVLDIAAAGIAVVITFAMLAAVKSLLESGHDLSDTKMLTEAFKRFRKIGNELKDIPIGDLKGKGGLIKIVQKLLAGR
jgi:small GTP-binding protein